MAPRRRKSQTSEIAQDAEMRLDATADKPEPPAEDTASVQTPVEAASIAAEAAPEPGPEPTTVEAPPVVPPMAEQPATHEPKPEPVKAPEVAVKPQPRVAAAEAPPVRTSRLLAGDRQRESRSRKGRRTALLLGSAAAIALLAWTGLLTPFLPFGGGGGEGATPPPRISDTASAGQPLSSEPRPVARREDTDALRTEIEALKQTADKADTDLAKRITDLSARVEKMEKDQAARIAALTERLDKAEQRLADTAIAPAATASASTAPEPAAATQDDPAPQEAATTTDPVIAATGNPLPQPRPSDLGAVSVSRPQPQEASVEPQQRTSPDGPVRRDWVLRDVYSGVALIEGRWGMIEVVEGSVLPGGGVVQSIRRAGNRWIVTTSRGIITAGR